MTVIVLDLETTVAFVDGNKDNSPFNQRTGSCQPTGVCWTEKRLVKPSGPSFITKSIPGVTTLQKLKADLAAADVLVAHNAKFDVMYLLEAGFEIPERVHCTMILEYIFARAQNVDKSLKGTAERRDVTRKRDDLVGDLFKKGIGFEEMPLANVVEYADTDVLSCAEIYVAQMQDLKKEQQFIIGKALRI